MKAMLINLKRLLLVLHSNISPLTRLSIQSIVIDRQDI